MKMYFLISVERRAPSWPELCSLAHGSPCITSLQIHRRQKSSPLCQTFGSSSEWRLFALRSPQASDGPRTTYITRAPLPHPLHSHPQVVFLSFISVSVCLLHAPCGCARVYARVRREKKKDNSGRQDDKDVRCLRASYSFCTESDANFTRLAVEDCF